MLEKKIATPGSTGRLLKEMGKKPVKGWGQNFLIDHQIACQIAASLPEPREQSGVHIIEIGAGLGALSQLLTQQANRLILLEIDPDLASHLRQTFNDTSSVRIVQEDALQVDYDQLVGGDNYHIFGNVPYNITSELIAHLASFQKWQSATLLLQKEAAERLLAGPGRRNCPLALRLFYCCSGQYLFSVPPSCFHPMPKVDSAVIQLCRRLSPPVDCTWDKMEPLIQAAFALRRKSLLNALMASSLRGDKPYWQQILTRCGLDLQIRGEALTLADFSRLALAVDAWKEE